MLGAGSTSVDRPCIRSGGPCLRRRKAEVVLQQPLGVVNRLEQYDVVATVTGGGLSGQAGAMRHGISKATLKYTRLDVDERARKQKEWNQPVTWPLYAGALFLFALLLPGIVAYRRRQQATARAMRDN